MSQDLFAAFQETSISTAKDEGYHQKKEQSLSLSPQDSTVTVFSSGQDARKFCPSTAQNVESRIDVTIEDDDFGDFEDATAPRSLEQERPKLPFSTARKIDSKADEPQIQVGRHPFAGHMDILFDVGDDEYDAGLDDLENLANNPEAAMNYSKRIIAEQEARRTSPQASQSTSIQDSRPHGRVQQASKSSSHHDATRGEKNVVKAPPAARPSSQASTPAVGNTLQKKSDHAPSKNPNILFDADDLSEGESDDDDDFGDFEGGPDVSAGVVPAPLQYQSNPIQSMPAEIDLLRVDDADQFPSHSNGNNGVVPKSAGSIRNGSRDTRKNPMQVQDILGGEEPWPDFESAAPQALKATEARASIDSDTDNNSWDDFENPEPAFTTSTPAATSDPAFIPTSVPKMPSNSVPEPLVPPTNIPPPAILLSIFPSILSGAQEALFTPLSKLDAAQRQQLLAHPATCKFLHNHLQTSIVLAHIIAGRKQRWKRDQILSQSMRIGPATAGGRGGGMKLAGVDRAEVMKEEREVLDAVRAWKAQIGKLKGALASASATAAGRGAKFPPVPEISEAMPVKAVSAIEGGFTALHACALCGLKREERVAKIDVGVEDSFGEWWVNGMDMHVVCKNWWGESKARLKSR